MRDTADESRRAAVPRDAVAAALAAGGAFAWCSDARGFACEGAAAALLGREPSSPDDLASLVHPDDQALRAADIAAAAARGGTWITTFRSARDEGRWVEERGRASPGAAGPALAA